MNKVSWIPAFAGVTLLAGCATVPPKPMIPTAAPALTRYTALTRLNPQELPSFEDDMDTASLRTAAFQSRRYYENLSALQPFVLGSDTYTARELADSMAVLMDLLDNPASS